MTMIISGSDGLEFPDGSDQTSAYTGNASTITTGVLATANGGTGTTSYVATQWTTSGANISYTTGNVGIGTSSPSVKLDVVGGDFVVANGADAGNAGGSVFFKTSANSTYTPMSSIKGLLENATASEQQGGIGFSTRPVGSAGQALTERMRINSSGNVGIGTDSPVGLLHLNTASGSAALFINSPSSTGAGSYISMRKGGAAKFLMGVESTLSGTSDNGLLYVYGANALTIQTNGAERARISATGGLSVGTTADPGAGAIYATGNITAYYSDDRLKTKLGGIENALDKVKSLSGFYYEANKTAQDLGYQAVREVGVSAQQVQAVMPEVVKPAPIDQQYLTVDYERLVPLLIEAIKELEEKVAKLEAK